MRPLSLARTQDLVGSFANSRTPPYLLTPCVVFSDRRAGRYSGGMKRRLSVACALVGCPSVVFLDEPSTGLDPAARHQLWEVVANEKVGKSMILTTHSMEEADVLADRVGIQTNGVLRCDGTSPTLKSTYGIGFALRLSSTLDDVTAISSFVRTLVSFAIHFGMGNLPHF